MLIFSYIVLLLILAVFSYGFVDPSFPYHPPDFLYELVFKQRFAATIVYLIIIILLFIFYGLLLYKIKKKQISSKKIWQLIFISVGILFFAFPGFSNDIFNYIATAKITYFYRENPYVVMPIEIPNEPMLAFVHAANKKALYGLTWILLSFIPHVAGFGNLILTIFTFKAFIILFYLGLIWLIWSLSEKNILALAIFALNPLVMIETLVSSHNDVVMMFFALIAFYHLKPRYYVGYGVLFSSLSMIISIFIKYATVFLLPVYFFAVYHYLRKKEIEWFQVWFYAVLLMYSIFFLSPLREEIYSWYFTWPFAFVALLSSQLTNKIYSKTKPLIIFIIFISLSFSLGLLLRFTPFIFTREWGGITPLVKKILTFLPPLLMFLYLSLVNFYFRLKERLIK